jgi:competence protein CoiA
MLTALVGDQCVLARDVEKGEGPYTCPDKDCPEPDLILRKGEVVTHHFAHRRLSSCSMGGESIEHAECKQAIYDGLRAHGLDCYLEKGLEGCRPDILMEGKHNRVAIEVQISRLTIEEITRRTAHYAELGIYVLWLSPWREQLEQGSMRPQPWELWLHACYFGRVYYWLEREYVAAVHFDRGQSNVRIPKPLDAPLSITQLWPTERSAWQGGRFMIPRCLIVKDNQRAWWQ